METDPDQNKPKDIEPGKDDIDAGSITAAAKFVGCQRREVLSFRKDGDRYIVVTTSGQKLTETPDEVKARVAAAEKAAKKAQTED